MPKWDNSYSLHLATNLQHDLQIISENKQDIARNHHSGKYYTNFSCFLTFKEDKIPLTVFINCINAGRQSPPEVGNLHRVSIHHSIVSDSPKPLILETKYTSFTILWAFMCVQLLSWKYWTTCPNIFIAWLFAVYITIFVLASMSHPHIKNMSELVVPWGENKLSMWTMCLV